MIFVINMVPNFDTVQEFRQNIVGDREALLSPEALPSHTLA